MPLALAGADMVWGVGHGAGGVDQVGHDVAIPADLGSSARIWKGLGHASAIQVMSGP